MSGHCSSIATRSPSHRHRKRTREARRNSKLDRLFNAGTKQQALRGMWCPDHGTVNVAYVLPLEPECRDLLESIG